MELGRLDKVIIIESPRVKNVISLSADYTLESSQPITSEGPVMYIENALLTAYKNGVEVKSVHLSGKWRGRIHYIHDRERDLSILVLFR